MTKLEVGRPKGQRSQGGLAKMRKLVLPISVLLVCPMLMAGGNSLSADDIAKIKRVHALYQEAWLRGDAGGERAALSVDGLLLPAHGDIRLIGPKGLHE